MFDTAVADPQVRADATDLDDSLDIRLIVAGLMSPTTIPVRRARAELARVLARPSTTQATPAADPRGKNAH